MDKFAHRVKPGGLLLYDNTNMLKPFESDQIEIIGIAATTEALLMKNARLMNMIVLGAFLAYKPLLPMHAIMKGLENVLPEKYHHTLPANNGALEIGAALMQQYLLPA
jgi:2-oxoglutarate ferredoxin oxidoreductase subunit gamma